MTDSLQKEKLEKLLQNKKVKKQELLALLNELKTEQNAQKLNALYKNQKVTKKDVFDLFFPSKTLTKTDSKKRVSKITIFKGGIFFIFTVSFIMAIVNVYNTLLKSNEWYHALPASISLVGFNLICFESFILILPSKIRIIYKIPALIFFALMFAFLTNYILISVSNAQFDRYQETVLKDKIKNKDYLININDTNKEDISELKNEMQNRINKRDDLETYIKNLDKNSGDYKNKSWLIVLLNNEIKTLKKKLDDKREEQRQVMMDNKSIVYKKVSFFEFFDAKIFKDSRIDTGFLEFLMILLPSLAYDLISSMSLALVFFMKEEYLS
jgi:hypothetical protein